MDKKIFTLVTTITTLLGAIAGVIGTAIAYKSVSLEEKRFQMDDRRFRMDNRPYVIVDDLKWIGNIQDFFLLNIRSNGKNPVGLFLKVRISDNQNTTIFENDYQDEIKILPDEKNKIISINQSKIKYFFDSLDQINVISDGNLKETSSLLKDGQVKFKIVPKTELEKEGVYIDKNSEKGRLVFGPKFIKEIKEKMEKNEIFIIEIELRYGELDGGDYSYTYKERRYLRLGKDGKIETGLFKKDAN